MIEYYTGLSADYFIIGIAVLCLIIFIFCIVLAVKFSKLKKKYNTFMSGRDGESLEDSLIARLEQVDRLMTANNVNERNIEDINKKMLFSLDKFAVVKYDALDELGGKLSYSLVILDEKNNGFIINNMHGRDGNYSYLKEVINGNTVANLSDEEKEALNKAMSGEDR